MAAHMQRRRGTGSAVILAIMYGSVVGYLALVIWFYGRWQVFLPAEVTLGFFAVFGIETASMAAMKMAKEKGSPMPARTGNGLMQNLGLYQQGAFDEMAQQEWSESEQQQQEGESDEQQ